MKRIVFDAQLSTFTFNCRTYRACVGLRRLVVVGGEMSYGPRHAALGSSLHSEHVISG